MHDIQKETVAILRGVAKKTKSKTVKKLIDEKECQAACSAADQLFHEALECFREGDMTWAEAIEDLYKNLKAVPAPKGESYGE